MQAKKQFPRITYVGDGFRVDIKLSRFSRQFAEAQWWLGEQVLAGCKPFMPYQTGNLIQRSYTEKNGARVVFPGPYARYLYMGKVMVDSVTGKGPRKIPVGPGGDYILRFRKGAKLVPTERRLNYAQPQATDHWFEEAKKRYGGSWIEGAKKIAGGR